MKTTAYTLTLVAAVAAIPTIANAQQQFTSTGTQDASYVGMGWQPGFGGFPFWGFMPGTAASSELFGAADVIRARGESNLLNSEAAKNYEQARSMEIDNRVKWTDAYRQMRVANRNYIAAKVGPRLSDEQIIQIAQRNRPARLNAGQLDPLSGALNWPSLLQGSEYAAQRERLDELFALRATGSGVSPNLTSEIRQQTRELLASLEQNARFANANDWIAARRFVESLASEAQMPTG